MADPSWDEVRRSLLEGHASSLTEAAERLVAEELFRRGELARGFMPAWGRFNEMWKVARFGHDFPHPTLDD
ncbi:MAG: hypothetical protein ACR2QM_20695 [Longimicrobiales bacterium]